MGGKTMKKENPSESTAVAKPVVDMNQLALKAVVESTSKKGNPTLENAKQFASAFRIKEPLQEIGVQFMPIPGSDGNPSGQVAMVAILPLNYDATLREWTVESSGKTHAKRMFASMYKQKIDADVAEQYGIHPDAEINIDISHVIWNVNSQGTTTSGTAVRA